ncbi:unnamed protein product [Durusdinium trenchii]|uniref:CRC domain-containing protein n=1 Tax=Durusdinium trenchii TaxID=1381693 RepID=A0ABP0SMQ3_9DINO
MGQDGASSSSSAKAGRKQRHDLWQLHPSKRNEGKPHVDRVMRHVLKLASAARGIVRTCCPRQELSNLLTHLLFVYVWYFGVTDMGLDKWVEQQWKTERSRKPAAATDDKAASKLGWLEEFVHQDMRNPNEEPVEVLRREIRRTLTELEMILRSHLADSSMSQELMIKVANSAKWLHKSMSSVFAADKAFTASFQAVRQTVRDFVADNPDSHPMVKQLEESLAICTCVKRSELPNFGKAPQRKEHTSASATSSTTAKRRLEASRAQRRREREFSEDDPYYYPGVGPAAGQPGTGGSRARRAKRRNSRYDDMALELSDLDEGDEDRHVSGSASTGRRKVRRRDSGHSAAQDSDYAVPSSRARSPATHAGRRKKRQNAQQAKPPKKRVVKPNEFMCRCARNRCVKFYCPCFVKKTYCNAACECNSCENTSANPSHSHFSEPDNPQIQVAIDARAAGEAPTKDVGHQDQDGSGGKVDQDQNEEQI